MKDRCEEICLKLEEALAFSPDALDGEMTTTVNQVMEATIDLKGPLVTLINIATSLTDDPSVKDRVKLEENWFKFSKKAINVSRSTASLLRSLVQIIDMRARGSEGNADAGTGS